MTFLIGTPPKRISPSAVSLKRNSAFAIVLLPEPVPPTIAVTPLKISKVISDKTGSCAPLYVKSTCLKETIGLLSASTNSAISPSTISSFAAKTAPIRSNEASAFGIITITIAAIVKNHKLKTVYSLIAVKLPIGTIPCITKTPPKAKTAVIPNPITKFTVGFNTAKSLLTAIITSA